MYATTLGMILTLARVRRRLGTVALVALCAAVGLGVSISRRPGPPVPAVAASKQVSPATVLASAPFMGVACRSHTCDWVGLSIWLRRPAVAVRATIEGHPLTLVPTRAYPRPGARATFVGYLRPYRLITHVPLLVGLAPTAWKTAGPGPSPRAAAHRLRPRAEPCHTTERAAPARLGIAPTCTAMGG